MKQSIALIYIHMYVSFNKVACTLKIHTYVYISTRPCFISYFFRIYPLLKVTLYFKYYLSLFYILSCDVNSSGHHR